MERHSAASSLRYKNAQEILFGQNLDLKARFKISDDAEKGTILLNKIFEIYQASHNITGVVCLPSCDSCCHDESS